MIMHHLVAFTKRFEINADFDIKMYCILLTHPRLRSVHLQKFILSFYKNLKL